jgi:hypothetical protein
MSTTDASISRVPPIIDLELYAGDGIGIKFTMKDPAGNPWPLDGDVTSQVKNKRTDTDPLVSWTVDPSQFAQGIILISLTGTQTASLIPEGKQAFNGVWDLQYIPTGSEAMTLFQGKVTCDADVTH